MKARAIAYACEKCGGKCTAPTDHVLALLQLCAECQAKRYSAGIKAQNTTPPAAAQRTGEH